MFSQEMNKKTTSWADQ